ncbi:MAG: hypothetical protein PVF71_05285, partial [Desulfobacterales bacterium]
MGNNIKRIYLFSIVFLTVTLLKGPGLADDKARDRSTLKGIQAVVVIVHAVAPEWQAELAKVGLSESALQATVEQQLQKAGIRVVAEEAASRSEFEGILNVRLSFADPEPAKKQFPALGQKEETIEKVDVKKRYVYAIRLNLRQLVSLKRDPAAEAFSITWQTESVGMRRLSLIQERIK